MEIYNKIEFSLAMCVYGGDNPQYFSEALESIHKQTRQPNEFVLTVDGPISNEFESIIEKYQSLFNCFRIVRLTKNLGHGKARKICIENCSMPIIAIADADDINDRTRFAKQIQCFEDNPIIDVVGSSQKNFINNIENIVQIRKRPEKHEAIIELMHKQCPITQACVVFRRDIYEKAGGYREIYCAEDYDLWIRMYEAGAVFYNVPEYLVFVRSSEDQYKRRGGWKYFKSTYKISKYMYSHNIINFSRHIKNVVPRFVLQVLMPAGIRGYIRNVVLSK